MSVTRHEIQQENVGAYLLGALSDVEEQAFVRHLQECPVCSDEVARLRPAADALPRSVTPMVPPPGLKTSLMKVVEAEARERAGTARPRPLAALRARLGGIGASLTSGRPSLALAGATFLLFVGALTGYAVNQVTSDGQGSEALAAKVDKTRVPHASASLTVSSAKSEKNGILRVHGMPTLQEHSTYQVWVKKGKEIIASSLFNVGQDGDGAAAVAQNLDGAHAVMVTREPAGGARAPSEEPVLSVSL